MSDIYNDLNLGIITIQFQEPILCFNVTLPSGQCSLIKLFQYDTPLQMAFRFAVENSLQIKFVKQISESINQIISASLIDPRVEGIQFNVYQIERIKQQIRQSYSKYVVESLELDFKMDYNLSELVDLGSEYQKQILIYSQPIIINENEKEKIFTEAQQKLITPSKYQNLQPKNYGQVYNQEQQDQLDSSKYSSNSLQTPNIYDRALNYKQMTQEKSQYIRGFQEQNELKNCTFSPQVNHAQENVAPHRFQKLYEYGKQKVIERRSQSDQKELKEYQNCTFSPKIGQKSRLLSKNHPKLVQIQPANQVSKLLKQLMSLKSKKEHVPQQSLQMLRQIFEQLDDDRDDQISADHISVSTIDIQTIKILYPFLQWMDDQQIILNFEQFESAIHQHIPNIDTLLRQTPPIFNYSGKVSSKQPNFNVKVKNQYKTPVFVKKVPKKTK